MCGFVGIINQGDRCELSSLARATALIAHRGREVAAFLLVGRGSEGRPRARVVAGEAPHRDPAGSRGDPVDIAVGFRRLAIRAPGLEGRQPMTLDGRCWLFCNGEIYNDDEVGTAQKSASEGARSDVHNLLQGWARRGPAVLRHAVGMFALAVLDLDRRQLYLARDPFGIKPLYYSLGRRQMLFGSDPRALVTLLEETPVLDAQSARSFLEGGATDTRDVSFVTSIRQVPPGQTLQFDLDRPGTARAIEHWSPADHFPADLTLDEAARRVRETLIESVALHLRADTEVGAALSGGIDSTLTVAVMRELMGPQPRIPTFSYLADTPEKSDASWIAIAEREIAVDRHHYKIDPEELSEQIETMLEHLGEPVESPAIFAQYRLYANVRAAGIEVLINGHGADELFAGYPSVIPTRIAELAQAGRWAEADALANAAQTVHGQPRAAALARAAALLPPTLAAQLRDSSPGCSAPVGSSSPPRGEYEHGSCLTDQRRAFLRVGLPSLLRCDDRNSMAFSVESRVPFLTHRVAELALSLRGDLLVGGDSTLKLILRRAFPDLLPREIVERRPKIGFATPSRRWIEALLPWAERWTERARVSLPADVAEPLPAECATVRRLLSSNPAAASDRFVEHVWRPATLAWWIERHRIDPSPLFDPATKSPEIRGA